MAASRFYSSTAGLMTLNGAINASVTSATLSAVTGLPGTRPYTLMIDPGLSTEELVDVTAIGGLVVTITRGVDGTTAQSHLSGAEVRHASSGRDFQDSRNHEGSVTEHGATGAVVGTTNTQTLTNKTIDGDVNTLTDIAAGSIKQAAWTTYVPTLTGFSLGNGTMTAAYVRIGNTIMGRVAITFGSTSTFTTTVSISVPVTALDFELPVGNAYMVDISVGSGSRQGGTVYQVSTTAMQLVSNTAGGNVNTTHPFTWATSDILNITFSYEAA